MADVLFKLCISHLDLENKNVLIRVDYNLPYDANHVINDDFRVKATLDTIKEAIKKKAKSIILISHRGRPCGEYQEVLSLKPVAEILEKLLERDVKFVNDCIGPEVEEVCLNPTNKGTIILLENLRFHKEEQKLNCTSQEIELFENNLRKLADFYVNDAFATLHRSDTSMLGLGFSKKAAGFLLREEFVRTHVYWKNTEKKELMVAILGGNKVADKICSIDNFLDKMGILIIAGGMAYTFLKLVFNFDVGSTDVDLKSKEAVENIMSKAKKNGVSIHLPEDFVIGDAFSDNCKTSTADLTTGIPIGWYGFDIGPKSIEKFSKLIEPCETIIWNGPVGAVRFDKFSNGTEQLLRAVIAATDTKGMSLIGGGRTASCAIKLGGKDKFSHISTGGGAFLQIIEGRRFPSVEALSSRFS